MVIDDLIYGKLLDSLYPKSFLMTDENGLQHEVIHYGDVKNAIEDLRIELKQRVGLSKMENVGVGDTISRQDAIDALDCISGVEEVLRSLPSAQPETCEGCKHFGKWANEVEYGYPSPCTCCKRRVEDHYER